MRHTQTLSWPRSRARRETGKMRGDPPKYTAKPYISLGLFNPPNPVRRKAGRKPRHAYPGANEARTTRIVTILRFPRPKRRWRYGQASEPMIPKVGTMIPMYISEEAGMNRTVLEKRIAVEVMVVKPGRNFEQALSEGCNEMTDHRRGGTTPPST